MAEDPAVQSQEPTPSPERADGELADEQLDTVAGGHSERLSLQGHECLVFYLGGIA
jgi:hypothetical protein